MQFPPTPGTGVCLCGAAYYYERATRIGEHGHFHCRRCGRRYRMSGVWSPAGSDPAQDDEPRTPVVPGEEWPS